MSNESSPTEEPRIDRRTVLKGVGTATTGLAFSSSAAAARGGPPSGTGRGNSGGGPPSGTGRDNSRGGGGACHQNFDCDEAEGTYVKFEYDDTECEFVEETETGLIDVSVTDSKDGEDCEPIAVEWTGTVSEVLAFGGGDCDSIEDPDGSYRSGLENGGGQTAAISNLQFCVVEGASCVDCDSGSDLLVKYEWDDEEETLVPEGDTDEQITLDSVTLDDSGEAATACFSTDYCDVDAWVKAGQETERYADQSGDFCVTGIDGHAISHVAFFCERTAYSPGNS